MNPKLDLMLQYLNGDLSQPDLDELSSLIRHDREFRKQAAFLLYQQVHLRELAQEAKADGIDWLPEPDKPSRSTSLREALTCYRVVWAAGLGLACLIVAIGALIYFPRTSAEAQIADVRGGVYLERTGQRAPAGDRLRLRPGDRLVLSPDAAVTVRYGGEATWFRLANSADAQLAPQQGGKSIFLRQGTLTAVVARQPSGSPVQVQTPRATASVLGTEFTMTADDTATRLEVWKGRVRFTRRLEESSLMLGEGQYAIVQDSLPFEAQVIRRGVLRQSWPHSDFGPVAELSSVMDALGPPHESSQLVDFQTTPNMGDDFVARFRAYLRPPTTGDYQFWVAADDAAVLWLSSDENESRKTRICATSAWTGAEEWTKSPAQQSGFIWLEAGRTYYIEALQQERAGGDHLAVAWKIPGQPRDVIRGRYLTIALPAVNPQFSPLP